MNIYVGNLPYAATETDLEELFGEYGQVATATIIRDRYDARSKGFGFVEMENQEDGHRAIQALNGQEMMGRPLKVNEARPREDRAPSQKHSETQQTTRTQGTDSSGSQSSSGDTFHNPYTFVPSPPRDHIKAGEFAGDFDPLKYKLDHASLKKDLWTGHIPIKLTTVTPLVLLKDDGKKRDPKKHQIYEVLDYLPESSLRGMLRSAYEVVTNSRYTCFHNPDRLTYRVDRKKVKYKKSPEELLHHSLKPAKRRSVLSPADRLFGWVLQSGDQNQETDTDDENKKGYKSRIRIVCENGERPCIVEEYTDNPVPLTILGQPKPEQVRFYVAKDVQGNPQEDGISKSDAGYAEGKTLRGRKHYWHHRGLEEGNDPEYWIPSGKNRIREYIRTGRKADPQNRSIKGWIKPGTEFEVSLYVQNLQREEVGALLWLLSLSELYEGNYYFRLGYGKPLGFGSVRLEVDAEHLPLGTGKDWKEYYAALDEFPPATLDKSKRKTCMQVFEASMVEAYNTDNTYPTFDDLPFICDFLQVLSGPTDDAPIHYPRLDPKPAPEGENFRWFTENEKKIQKALPAVYDPDGLPYKP